MFAGRYRGDWDAWCRDIWFPGNRLRDPHEELIVESKTKPFTHSDPESDLVSALPSEASCTWTSYTPNELLLRVEAAGPSMLVVAEQYEPGWQVEMRKDKHQSWRSEPLYRAHGALRAVHVPQGVCEVRMRFVPRGWRVGVGVSLITWGLMAVELGLLRWGDRPVRTRQI